MALFIGPNSGTNISTSTAAWVKILKVTGGSTISNITYDDLPTDTYRCLRFIGGVIPQTDQAHLNFYFRTNGSDEVNNTYSYGLRMNYESNNSYTTAEQNEGRMKLVENAGTVAGEGHRVDLLIQMSNGNDTAQAVDLGNFCMWHCQRIDQSGNWRGGQGTGWYDDSCHPNGFKIQMSTGQITDYNYALYGLLA